MGHQLQIIIDHHLESVTTLDEIVKIIIIYINQLSVMFKDSFWLVTYKITN
jgi:hypothetical protein